MLSRCQNGKEHGKSFVFLGQTLKVLKRLQECQVLGRDVGGYIGGIVEAGGHDDKRRETLRGPQTVQDLLEGKPASWRLGAVRLQEWGELGVTLLAFVRQCKGCAIDVGDDYFPEPGTSREQLDQGFEQNSGR